MENHNFQNGELYYFSWSTSVFLSSSFLKFGGQRAAFNLFVTGSISYGLLTIAVAISGLTHDKLWFALTFTVFYSVRGMCQALLFSSINTILLSEEFGEKVSFAKAMDTLAYTVASIFSFILSGYLYGQFGFQMVVIILGMSLAGFTSSTLIIHVRRYLDVSPWANNIQQRLSMDG